MKKIVMLLAIMISTSSAFAGISSQEQVRIKNKECIDRMPQGPVKEFLHTTLDDFDYTPNVTMAAQIRKTISSMPNWQDVSRLDPLQIAISKSIETAFFEAEGCAFSDATLEDIKIYLIEIGLPKYYSELPTSIVDGQLVLKSSVVGWPDTTKIKSCK